MQKICETEKQNNKEGCINKALAELEYRNSVGKLEAFKQVIEGNK